MLSYLVNFAYFGTSHSVIPSSITTSQFPGFCKIRIHPSSTKYNITFSLTMLSIKVKLNIVSWASHSTFTYTNYKIFHMAFINLGWMWWLILCINLAKPWYADIWSDIIIFLWRYFYMRLASKPADFE